MTLSLHHGTPCPYCNRTMGQCDFRLRPTRDHIVPKSRGGAKKIICCNQCNGIKGDMMPNQWHAYMQANPRWWILTRTERRARIKAAKQMVGVKSIHGNFIKPRNRQGSPAPAPVVVPPELIYNFDIWPISKLPEHTASFINCDGRD